VATSSLFFVVVLNWLLLAFHILGCNQIYGGNVWLLSGGASLPFLGFGVFTFQVVSAASRRFGGVLGYVFFKLPQFCHVGKFQLPQGLVLAKPCGKPSSFCG